MSRVRTLCDLFQYNDWARDQVLALADQLSDEQLDRAFPIGSGTLRETLRHLYGAERVWHERILGRDPGLPHSNALRSTSELRSGFYAVAAERDDWLAALDDAALDRVMRYKRLDGTPCETPLGVILLHICNHGVHHRAQAVNMLRHVGAPPIKRGIDYIFLRLQRAEQNAPPAAMDIATIRTLYAYNDWARDRVLSAAAALTDEQLDRPFEMGEGTLRGTLQHLRAAEQWWYVNWTVGPGEPFPEGEPGTPVAEIARQHAETATARERLLAGMSDRDLERIVTVRPRPDIERQFPIGVSMLQLWCHGTHHRAQAVNMLRRVGAQPPAVDLVLWSRESSGIT